MTHATENRAAGLHTSERRTLPVEEVRVERGTDGKPTRIVGRAAVFGQTSLPLSTKHGTKFVEQIAPGAFKRSLAGQGDILALVEHDPRQILGRRSAGTLKLTEDDKGLAFELTPADTTAARDAIANIDHGNIRGMSFGFGTPEDTWEKREDGMSLRTLTSIPLAEVSVTGLPAYEGTEVDLRSVELSLARPENRAIVTVNDDSLVYLSQYAVQYVRSAQDALQRIVTTIAGYVDAELSDQDVQALSDLSDQIDLLDAKIDQVNAAMADATADPAAAGDEMRTLAADLLKRGLDVPAEIRRAIVAPPETRAGHMTHGSSGPALCPTGAKNAEDLVKAKQVDDGPWSWSDDDAKALLGKDGDDWDALAKWMLAEDGNAQPQTMDRYKYPFGKGDKVSSRALAAIKTNATKNNATAIVEAAGELLDSIKA